MNTEQLHAAAVQNLEEKRAAFNQALQEVMEAERELGVVTERLENVRSFPPILLT